MPVEIKIYGETAKDVTRELRELTGSLIQDIEAGAPSIAVIADNEPAETPKEEPKKRGRKPKETTDDKPEEADAGGVTEADAAQAGASADGEPESGDDAAPARTYEETRALLLKLSAKITPPKAMAFLEEHGGVKKLGDMKEDQYGAFYDKLEKELGE